MTIQRTTDPAFLGAALVRPDVRDLVDGFDATDWLADPRNIALHDGDNITLFEQDGEDVYAGHILFTSRGRAALDLGCAMLGAMFANYGARVITGLVPKSRKASRWFSRRLGFKSCGMIDTVRGSEELFILEKSRWAD